MWQSLANIASQNQSVADYEIIPIEKSKGVKYENLLAVCHDCFQKYTLSHAKADKQARKYEFILSAVDATKKYEENLSVIASLKHEK